MKCMRCDKTLTEKEVCSRGELGVRCEDCTRKMLAGAKVSFLDTRTGKIRSLGH